MWKSNIVKELSLLFKMQKNRSRCCIHFLEFWKKQFLFKRFGKVPKFVFQNTIQIFDQQMDKCNSNIRQKIPISSKILYQ